MKKKGLFLRPPVPKPTYPRPTARVVAHVSDDFPAPFHGCFSSQSFWKAGSERKGSQNGSSLRRAGVMGGRT
jgi:hypothetical protein